MTPENKSLHAAERETPHVQQARALYRRQSTALDRRRVTCVDASGVHLARTRLDGRAPTGARVMGSVPQHDGQPVTLLGALGVQGLQAVMPVDGATDTEGFRASSTHGLGPTLTPGAMVVMDHRLAHDAVGIQQALARRGARLRYWPPLRPTGRPSNRAGRR